MADKPIAAGRPITIVLAELPPMLRDIVAETVRGQPDMSVVGEIEGPEELAVVSEERPDVLILGLADAELPDVYRDLFVAYPRMRIVAVSGDGRQTFVYELRQQAVSLGELSPRTILQAIGVR